MKIDSRKTEPKPERRKEKTEKQLPCLYCRWWLIMEHFHNNGPTQWDTLNWGKPFIRSASCFNSYTPVKLTQFIFRLWCWEQNMKQDGGSSYMFRLGWWSSQMLWGERFICNLTCLGCLLCSWWKIGFFSNTTVGQKKKNVSNNLLKFHTVAYAQNHFTYFFEHVTSDQC